MKRFFKVLRKFTKILLLTLLWIILFLMAIILIFNNRNFKYYDWYKITFNELKQINNWYEIFYNLKNTFIFKEYKNWHTKAENLINSFRNSDWTKIIALINTWYYDNWNLMAKLYIEKFSVNWKRNSNSNIYWFHENWDIDSIKVCNYTYNFEDGKCVDYKFSWEQKMPMNSFHINVLSPIFESTVSSKNSIIGIIKELPDSKALIYVDNDPAITVDVDSKWIITYPLENLNIWKHSLKIIISDIDWYILWESDEISFYLP